MQKYDSSVIESFAQALYDRAGTIVLVNTVGFALVAAAGGYFMFKGLGATLGLLLGGGLGFYLGQQKAFVLKLQAQTALCQVQIETNTRSPTVPSSSARSASLPIHDPSPLPSPSRESSSPPKSAATLGECPSCNATIPLKSMSCPNCTASFSGSSKLQVRQRSADA